MGGIVGQVHPRACGGNEARVLDNRRESGPSPRLRGKPHQKGTAIATVGSIPAPAGETA